MHAWCEDVDTQRDPSRWVFGCLFFIFIINSSFWHCYSCWWVAVTFVSVSWLVAPSHLAKSQRPIAVQRRPRRHGDLPEALDDVVDDVRDRKYKCQRISMPAAQCRRKQYRATWFGNGPTVCLRSAPLVGWRRALNKLI